MQSVKLYKIITKEEADFTMKFDGYENIASSYKDYQIDYFNKIEFGMMYDENEKLGIFFWKDDILIMHDYVSLNKNDLIIDQQVIDDEPVNTFYLKLKRR